MSAGNISEKKTAMSYRTEKDSMGEMQVPEKAYWGPQTQRAVENFPISDLRFKRPIIRALGIIKRSAAIVNQGFELLDAAKSEAIVKAAEEVESGKLDEHFVVDIFQTGSGTSSNMNSNEVISRRAKELSDEDIHPNDHVNMSQSSNDVIPTAIHIAAATGLVENLLPQLSKLEESLQKKAKEFGDIVKTGRTHLQDATPMFLGQEFEGYAAQIRFAKKRVEKTLPAILELAIGGTAIGTGINTPEGFGAKMAAAISERTGLDFVEAENHFEAQAAKDALVELSGQLKTIACSILKIANDLRWLGSGPRCGIGELALPAVQPGSSIMPGKVNPVIAESAIMVAAQVIGNDACVTTAAHAGSNFELNVAMPVIAHNILESIEILGTTSCNLAERLVDGLEANRERLQELAEANITSVTALAPVIGYDKAAAIAKEAFTSGESLRVVAKRHALMPDDELDSILDLSKMCSPGLS